MREGEVVKILSERIPGLAGMISALTNKSMDSITPDDIEYLKIVYGENYIIIGEILKKILNDG